MVQFKFRGRRYKWTPTLWQKILFAVLMGYYFILASSMDYELLMAGMIK